jgi:methylated-DNA-[protein]-cysteine S-methyltransferase
MVRYTVFSTKWGYFGLAGNEKGILKTVLPEKKKEAVERRLVEGLEKTVYEKGFLKEVQELVRAYFEGSYVDFGRDIPIVMNGGGKFSREVYDRLRDVTYGQTISYGQLAELAKSPGAARAVGQVMAKNNVPLIIPCHRVTCANGAMGGFSAWGGVGLKKKMLSLEREDG